MESPPADPNTIDQERNEHDPGFLQDIEPRGCFCEAASPEQGRHDPETDAFKVKLLYSHAYSSVAATVVNAILLVTVQWNVVPHSSALIWGAYMMTVMLLRAMLAFQYHRTLAHERTPAGTWRRYYIWSASATGIGWGSCALFFIPPSSVPHQFFTVFLLSGMASGAMTVLSPVLSAYVGYLIPLTIPITMVFLFYGDTLHAVGGAMMIVFTLFLLQAGRIQGGFVDSSLSLSLEKDDLLKRLALEKEQVESLNRDLRSEVDERVETEKKLQYRVRFESLLTSISNGFINLSSAEIDNGINRALEQVGLFGGIDRTYVFLFEKKMTEGSKTHEWCAPGIAKAFEHFQGLRSQDFEWWMDRMKDLLPIHIPRVEDLPPEAEREKALLLASSARSVLAVPLNVGRNIVGFLGFTSVRTEKHWDEESITLLKLFAEMLVNVLVRKRTEEELERAREAAEAAARAKAQFLANMSHEIRTPMHGVLGMLSLLRETELGAQQRAYADAAFKSAEMQISIIDDILDLSKIEAGRMTIESVPFDLRVLVRECEGLFEEIAGQKGLRLSCLMEKNVPSVVQGDPGRVRQILVNLLGNAVKFTSAGEVALGVGVEHLDDREARLRFEVRDTGIGIPGQVQTMLFEPFTQADGSTTRKFGGTGLGLAICKHLAEMMGGGIGVHSVEGQGATFWVKVTFKAPPSAQTEGIWAQGDVKTVSAPPAYGGYRALVVEDNAVNRTVAQAMLASLGLTVDFVENGQEAVEVLAASSFDVVLMDCQMPVLDGYEATRIIRQQERASGRSRLPIIALTANAMKEDRELCLRAGMDDYLSKPFSREDLERILTRWLRAGGAPG